MSFLFINKTLPLNNLKTRTAMNANISVFFICVEATIYLLLHDLHDWTFNVNWWYRCNSFLNFTIRIHFSRKSNFKRSDAATGDVLKKGVLTEVFVIPSPWNFAWSPALAPNLYLPSLTPNFYLPALAPNLYLPTLAINWCLPALASNLHLPTLAQICSSQLVFTDPDRNFPFTSLGP